VSGGGLLGLPESMAHGMSYRNHPRARRPRRSPAIPAPEAPAGGAVTATPQTAGAPTDPACLTLTPRGLLAVRSGRLPAKHPYRTAYRPAAALRAFHCPRQPPGVLRGRSGATAECRSRALAAARAARCGPAWRTYKKFSPSRLAAYCPPSADARHTSVN